MEQVGVDVHLPQGIKVHEILTVLERGRLVPTVTVVDGHLELDWAS